MPAKINGRKNMAFIVFQLVNTKRNKEMLSRVPHRTYHDLSIIYRWVVRINDDEIQSVIIQNFLANQLGMSEEDLYQIALENTRWIMPPVVQSTSLFLGEDISEGEKKDYSFIWIITNDRALYGATSILYKDTLHKLAQRLGSNLYILPSSINEVIAVSTNYTSEPNKLTQIVNEINKDLVKPEEFLSNQIYHYDKDLKKMTLITN